MTNNSLILQEPDWLSWIVGLLGSLEFWLGVGRTLWLACGRVAKGEIETLDMYLTGQVYGYVITRKKEEVDSLWDCYGYDYCLSEAKEVVDQLVAAEARRVAEAKAWEERVREDYYTYCCV